ncbi:MAG: MBL fold metallo-hydrolase [Actinobacteria bacterium]|nr:MBL fold metallo-hydrolase [Actinomycetota bacterium]MBU1942868.1 MBL fold metallo-hydrolase [Actinomycetota bacterium]MBU2687600.1 MBL fold metallo-hydrolase [Actinomycetota bacterium]
MIEVVPSIRMLPRTWGCNVYLSASGRGALVDGGFPLDTRRVTRAVSRMPSPPGVLVATHCHLDHMGTLAELKERFGSVVAAHGEDAPVMEGSRPYPMFKLDPLRAAYYKVLSPLYRYRYVVVDRVLEEGDIVEGLRVIHVPGHTEGSIVLYDAVAGALYSGDCIRNENGILDGPPPQFTPDMDLAFDCITEKILPLDFEVLLPGHGEPLVGGARDAVEGMVARAGRKG